MNAGEVAGLTSLFVRRRKRGSRRPLRHWFRQARRTATLPSSNPIIFPKANLIDRNSLAGQTT